MKERQKAKMKKEKKEVVIIEINLYTKEKMFDQFLAVVDSGKSIAYKKKFMDVYKLIVLPNHITFEMTSMLVNDYVESIATTLRDKKFNLVDVDGFDQKGEVIKNGKK